MICLKGAYAYCSPLSTPVPSLVLVCLCPPHVELVYHSLSQPSPVYLTLTKLLFLISHLSRHRPSSMPCSIFYIVRDTVTTFLEANGRGYWETSEENIELLQDLYQEVEDKIEGV